MTNLLLPRGTKDMLPEEKIVRDEILSVLKEVFELYGFSPLETPTFERFDVLSSKYAGGAEILKETFKFKDQGNRQLALRYDLTVPFSRVIAMNPTLKMPFKRYQIGRVYRDGPVSLARYREFYQCDVDVVGAKTGLIDAEIIALTSDVFRKLGLDVVIKVNNRKLLNGILDYAGIEKGKRIQAILIIDKADKIGFDEVEKELKKELKFKKEQVEKLMEVIFLEGSYRERIEKIEEKVKGKSSEGEEGLNELKEIFEYCSLMGVKNFVFDQSLARGLAYYTGPVFEVLLKDSKIKSSVTGGGRYDEMIGKLLGSKQEYPATGISFGLDRIYDAVIEKREREKGKEKLKIKKTVAQLYLIPIQTLKECLPILKELRELGVKAEMDLLGRGPSKNLNYANSMGIPYTAFIGEKEIANKEFSLKDMETGKETKVKFKELKKVRELIK